MKEEECKYIRTDVRYKNIYQIMLAISRGDIKIDESDDDESDLYLEMAMSGFPLPPVYAVDDRYGNWEVVKGSNIINGLLKYIKNKKHIEKYRARIEDTDIVFIVTDFCPENNYRIEEIKEKIKRM